MQDQALMETMIILLPLIFFGACIWIFSKLLSWARKRKTGAFVFGAITQIFLPDPYSEKNIEVFQETRKETVKKHRENGEPLEEE